MTTPEQIRASIAHAKIDQAIEGAKVLVAGTDLMDAQLAISNEQRRFKRESILGILSAEQSSLANARIAARLLELLREFEITELRTLKNLVSDVGAAARESHDNPEAKALGKELEALTKELAPIDNAQSKSEIAPDLIRRIGTTLTSLTNPESKERKTISVAKRGLELARKAARHYNSIAQWFGAPTIPAPFLE
jgi:hypothetical protein